MADPVTHHRAPALRLRPRCPVMLRDDETVQVGLRPPLAAQLPRHPDVMELLRGLETGHAGLPRTGPATAALRALQAADLVVDDDEARSPAASLAQFGGAAAERSDQRRGHRVAIAADAHTTRLVATLLTEAGLAHDDTEPTVCVVVDPGVVCRSRVDPLQRAGVPHLVVSGTPQGHRVGPFVEPGVTACLRCVDAEESADDPRLPLLLEQAARAGDPPPPDPVLERLALAWAVRDLARWAEGDEPSTWSATVDVGPTAAPAVTPRLRHPHCGCAWDALVQLV